MDVSSRGCAHARICAREDVRTAVFGKNIFLEKYIDKMKILQSIYIYIYLYKRLMCLYLILFVMLV